MTDKTTKAFSNNCPIVEQTADGHPVGRCWFWCGDNQTCPRHGDVSKALDLYNKTGKLTHESATRSRP